MNVAGLAAGGGDRFNRLARRTAETEAVGRWHLVSVLGRCWWRRSSMRRIRPKKFRAEFDPESYPAAAVKMLKADAAARIFTDDEWGDYLIWSLYPKNRVFVDGRSDFYGDDFEDKYIDVLKVKYGWERPWAASASIRFCCPRTRRWQAR